VLADEIDAIAAKRETAQREMERRIVAQMLTCMDDLSGIGPEPAQPGQPAAAADAVHLPDPEDLSQSHKHVIVIGEPVIPLLQKTSR
jgi:ribosome biogenesis ATPase